MDVSTDIFPTRSFQVDVSGVHGVHAGVWGVLRENFASSKLMGLYGGPDPPREGCRSFIFLNLVYRA